LCDQSINPTNPTSREHRTQVVVCGRASSRRGEISHPQVSQLRMGVPFKTLLHSTALHTSRTVFVHSSLLGNTLVPTKRLAHLLTRTGDCCSFTLCFHIETVKASLWHTGSIPCKRGVSSPTVFDCIF